MATLKLMKSNMQSVAYSYIRMACFGVSIFPCNINKEEKTM